MPTKDDQRRAYEARVWRLAFLLTGYTSAASELIGRVLRAQPDVLSVDPSRLDRLVILQAREWAARRRGLQASSPPLSPEGARTLTAALGMNHQLLEAWVLARVDGMEGLSVSRAMDCSNTAAANHLAEADREMGERLGPALAAGLGALRADADRLDPRPFLEASRPKRRRGGGRRLLVMLIALGAAAIGLWIAGVSGLIGPFDLSMPW
jgi:hypothetical protein